MTRLIRSHSLAICKALPAAVALTVALAGTAAQAREPGAGDAYSPGSSLGLPTGTNLPPGLWFEDTSSVYEFQSTSFTGSTVNGTKVTAVSTAPRVLWSTPYSVLGASEMAFAVFPIVDLNVSDFPGNPGLSGHSLAFADPEFVPLNLSWNLAPSVYGSVSLGAYPPIGRYSKTATVNLGNNFWTVQPEAALSYLSPDYVLSAHFFYNLNTENQSTHYTSGNQVFLDLTALRNIGKFQAGVVAYYDQQVTPDHNGGTSYGPAQPLFGEPGQFAPGFLLGYDAGKVNFQFYLTHDVFANDGGGEGTRAYLRILMRI